MQRGEATSGKTNGNVYQDGHTLVELNLSCSKLPNTKICQGSNLQNAQLLLKLFFQSHCHCPCARAGAKESPESWQGQDAKKSETVQQTYAKTAVTEVTEVWATCPMSSSCHASGKRSTKVKHFVNCSLLMVSASQTRSCRTSVRGFRTFSIKTSSSASAEGPWLAI